MPIDTATQASPSKPGVTPGTPNLHVNLAIAGTRIARISTVPFYIVAQLKNQIVYLGQHGAEVAVIASAEPELSAFDGLTGVITHAIDIPRSISPWRDFRALIRLWRFFRRHGAHIAHSTTPKAGLLAAIAAWLAGVPVRLHTFTGQPWVTMRGVTRHVARACDKLIGILNTRCYTDSPSQQRFLIDEGIIPAAKLHVIGLGSLAGVDTARFKRDRYPPVKRLALKQTLGIPEASPILLFVGRITADKGVRELLQAFQEIHLKMDHVHLLFVGHFDEQSGVASSITRQDVERFSHVHIVDYTPEPEAYMAIADILCLPSYREGFGTVVIEAAAMAVPTVGTEIYGLSDAVVDGETGILVPPRDVAALASALDRMLADPELRVQMGRAARQRVLQYFDVDEFNRKILEEYQAQLAQAGINFTHD